RRDDLESIGYMLVYLAKGSLPWQGLKKKKDTNYMEKIGDVKMCTSLNKLCEVLPSFFLKYISYYINLKFDETPEYEYLLNLFEKSCEQLKITHSLEWSNQNII